MAETAEEKKAREASEIAKGKFFVKPGVGHLHYTAPNVSKVIAEGEELPPCTEKQIEEFKRRGLIIDGEEKAKLDKVAKEKADAAAKKIKR